ncbi:hypothetical protein ACWGDT_46425 [Streptomyces avermitilis]
MNLRRLRQEDTDLRRPSPLFEEAIRQPALENDALRNGTTVVPLHSLSRTTSPSLPWPGLAWGQSGR